MGFRDSGLDQDSGFGNVQRFRGGLIFKAHRLVYHSTLGLRVIKKKKKKKRARRKKAGASSIVIPIPAPANIASKFLRLRVSPTSSGQTERGIT